ncbi:alpha amylase C-terminal domain-containing protein [Aeromonas simiae]|uniref:alpha amylase C-terminal domain-containing protein n=1 Tax=Aeromonas simiae TaxID=218936 RepID=UPI00266D507A|nr:alpha amylase C-terminal domain-containing protein [Aeromonas simiae]MDO2949431.1 alpha amylase C-terminal domain-containing protein [Aeromonas simiae]MDO2953053.1 alpha amylase C-terminal domain-containing protein [Aeromonas simiae]MDO2956703.1 alpha amylase C-terminal domain-containing protein [Aeromonas simiae]
MHTTLFRTAILAAALGSFSYNAVAEGVMVHLFQWKFNDVANECEKVLGPKGFGGVQITPPAEHKNRSDVWWSVYQPINFKNFNSFGGSEAELKSMINRCNAAGVKVYADAVFNQLAADFGNGTGGSYYHAGNKQYPQFGPNDFHHNGDIKGYSDSFNVWNGALYGMPDMKTESSYVQEQIATYMKTLVGWGVAGFRIDAAKHMPPADIKAILDKAGNPKAYLEVIGASSESADIQPNRYTYIDTVTDFKYGTDLAANFQGQIKNLKTLGEGWGLLPSNKAFIFVVNHDRERGHGGGGMLTAWQHGDRYNLANTFMMAWPYGWKQVMSGYRIENMSEYETDKSGPRSTPCTDNQWNCEQRRPTIMNMAMFHNKTDGQPVSNWWDNGNNQIAFGRGDKGFVAINNENRSLSATVQTGLPAGEYCNILNGNDYCSGSYITVDGSGKATLNVASMKAAAIVAGCTKNAPCSGDGPIIGSDKFSSMNLRGTHNTWGNTPMTVSEDRVWSAIVTFSGAGDTTGAQRFKFDVFGNWTENYGDNEGDGIADKGSQKDIFFNGTGKYRVSLKESDMSYSITALDENQAPIAAVSPKDISVKVGESVVFDASASSDDSGIESYSWSTGGSGKTETVQFDSIGTVTVTVTVADAEGLTDKASATVTVTDDNGEYSSVFQTMNFRGTPNSWGNQAMTLVGDNLWEAVVTFNGQANQRFKFDVKGDWSHNYGDNDKDGIADQTGDDIFTNVSGQYRVRFNDQTMQYSLSPVSSSYAKNFASLNFRGTTNNWGTTPMTLVGDHMWQATVNFTGAGDGNGGQRFKFDVKGDWTENYGDTNKDGVAERTGADIATSVTGSYLVRFNDQTLVYTLSAQ